MDRELQMQIRLSNIETRSASHENIIR